MTLCSCVAVSLRQDNAGNKEKSLQNKNETTGR